METKILNSHLSICLKIVGIWPGYTIVMAILASFFIFFAMQNLAENYQDIDAVSENLVSVIGNLNTALQIVILRLKRR